MIVNTGVVDVVDLSTFEGMMSFSASMWCIRERLSNDR